MVVGNYRTGPPSPAAGTTANGTSTTSHVTCHQQANMVSEIQSSHQLHCKPLFSVKAIAEQNDLQSTNIDFKDDVKEISETVPQIQVLPEEDETEGILIIDDNLNAASSAEKNFIQEYQDEDEVKDTKNLKIGNRVETHQKMDHAKKWLVGVMVITSTMSVVSLRSIEDSYKAHCQETDQEPLTTPVLARLIHSLFHDAVKCRLGPRGNQKIHYRKLAFKTDLKTSQDSSCEGNEDIQEGENKIYDEDKSFCLDDTDLDEPLNLSQKPQTQQDNIHDQTQVFEEQQVKKSMITLSGQEQEQVKSGQKQEQQVKNSLITQSGQKQIQEQEVTTSAKAALISEENKGANDDSKEECEAAADRLSQVLKWINKQGRKDVLLKEFAHSASCKEESCSHLCMMFRRVRRHVVAARHSCTVLKLYSVILRSHVSSCNDSDCGLPACPALRATRPKHTMDAQGNSRKRAACQISCGRKLSSSAVFEPRSPGGSLPGSPVNSPPPSPDAHDYGQYMPSLPKGSIQYMIVPVLPMVMSPSNHKVA